MTRDEMYNAAVKFADAGRPLDEDSIDFAVQQVNAVLTEAADMISEKAYETDLPDELAAMIRALRIK